MVRWSLLLIEKFGKVIVTLLVSGLIVLFSVSIVLLDSLAFDRNLYPSLYLSTIIPAIIAPLTVYFLLTIIVRLGRVEKEFATIIGSAGDAFFIHDYAGRILDVNDAACLSLGYTRVELLTLQVNDVRACGEISNLSADWARLSQGTVLTLDGVHRRKDGTTFPVEARVSLFEFGNEVNILALIRDVTDRVRDKNALQESEEKYRNLVETSHDLIWSVDVEGNFTFVNQASKLTHGYAPDEMIGKPFFHFMTPEQATIDLAMFVKIKEGVDHFDLDSIHLKKDGSPVHLNFNARVVRDSTGKVIGTTGSAKDISQRRQVEEQARLHQDQLAHVTRVATLGEMATDIAHELNQPLAAIAAFIDGSLRRLKSGELPTEEIFGALEKASEQAIRAGSVIQHLRDLVRREERQSENFDFNEAINEVLALLRADLDLKKIQLKLELTQEPPIIFGDPILLQQVILNLVRNSAEALDTVELEARQLSISTSIADDFVTVMIRDNGPGVDVKHQAKLFEPYFTTKVSGLGMGLPICRSIIHEHDGQISYQPAPDQGVIFHLQLPLSRAS